jgi:hypothetical protein
MPRENCKPPKRINFAAAQAATIALSFDDFAGRNTEPRIEE